MRILKNTDDTPKTWVNVLFYGIGGSLFIFLLFPILIPYDRVHSYLRWRYGDGLYERKYGPPQRIELILGISGILLDVVTVALFWFEGFTTPTITTLIIRAILTFIVGLKGFRII